MSQPSESLLGSGVISMGSREQSGRCARAYRRSLGADCACLVVFLKLWLKATCTSLTRWLVACRTASFSSWPALGISGKVPRTVLAAGRAGAELQGELVTVG